MYHRRNKRAIRKYDRVPGGQKLLIRPGLRFGLQGPGMLPRSLRPACRGDTKTRRPRACPPDAPQAAVSTPYRCSFPKRALPPSAGFAIRPTPSRKRVPTLQKFVTGT